MKNRCNSLLISAMIWACIFMMDSFLNAAPSAHEVASMEPAAQVVVMETAVDAVI